MKVEVASLDRVRKSIEVILDEEKLAKMREEIYEGLKKRAKIKGFRPGKVPKSVIQAYYRDYIDDELKRKMVEETMGDALSETNVTPVSEPRVQFVEEASRFGYTMECEIVPEIELPSYEGIEVEVEPIRVTDEEMGQRLEAMREMHVQTVDRGADEPAQKGDLVMVSYEAFREGVPVKGVKADAYPLDLGSSNLLPEFEAAVTGMKAGEQKEVEINFPADYPDKDIAGKRLLFKVLVKEVKQKNLPQLDDDFAKDVGFEHMEQVRSEVEKELKKEKEGQRRQDMTEQIARFLLEKTDMPVPARLLAKRVEMLVQEARSRMKTGALGEAEERSFNAALEKEYEPEAVKRIKMGMILGKIAEKEGIAVEDREVDARLKKIAEETKRAYDYVNQFYEKYNLKENLKNGMIEEKTIDLLIEKAKVKEKE